VQSEVNLPIPVQGSFLDFVFVQQKSQGSGNSIGAFTEFFGQIAFVDDHIPGWVALMDFETVGRNPIRESAELLFLLTLRTLASGLIVFQAPSARSCNSDSTSYQHDPPSAVLSEVRQPRRNSSWEGPAVRDWMETEYLRDYEARRLQKFMPSWSQNGSNACEKSPISLATEKVRMLGRPVSQCATLLALRCQARRGVPLSMGIVRSEYLDAHRCDRVRFREEPDEEEDDEEEEKKDEGDTEEGDDNDDENSGYSV
jgi:hypothetical protein